MPFPPVKIFLKSLVPKLCEQAPVQYNAFLF